MRTLFKLVGLLLLVPLTACEHGESALIARERFARQYRCPEDTVQVEDLTGESYRTRGCGRSAIYSCTSNAGSISIRCVQERGSGSER